MTDHYQTVASAEQFRGPIFRVFSDQVRTPRGDRVRRDYVHHPGAVIVVPYDEATGEVVLVCQYRHAVGTTLWELPAGLMDVAGEAMCEVAVRELAEEVDLRCGRLDLLVDLHSSPGCSNERVRIFLARELTATAQPHHREHEEATMQVARVALDEAVRMVWRGEITNAAAVAGVLATAYARDRSWATLRAVDAPWGAPDIATA